ncbi:hypothetical protein ACM9HD_33775 [Streptomyces sp. JAC25]|uniref:hypothetical protein n=1 Tax=Streptomyces TaxID=1883 RepID=UPI002272B5A5|nr:MULTISPECIES: hypothetical protein [Streptomyces]MCY1655578.1 hypothetical protein [Streptomyces sp. SL203]MCY1676943.1 hypothetical protein [Streptomyces sp. SL294]WJY35475.1 hypothetical protein QTO28_32570 [Streptomyces sp. P9-2B-1]
MGLTARCGVDVTDVAGATAGLLVNARQRPLLAARMQTTATDNQPTRRPPGPPLLHRRALAYRAGPARS